MTSLRWAIRAALAGVLALCIACSADAGGRLVDVTQTDDACTPDALTASPGEKLKFVITNQGSRDHEVEGIDGTKFEEVAVPGGKSRSLSWKAPKRAGAYKLKCYIPGGSSTIITLQVS